MAFEQTINYKKYLAFLEFKKSQKIVYKGINLIDACAIDFLDTMVCGAVPTWRYIIGQAIQHLDCKTLYSSFAQHNVVCTFDDVRRRDHWRLAQLVQQSIKGADMQVLVHKRRLGLALFSFLPYWYKLRTLLPQECKLSAKQRLFLVVKLIHDRQLVADLDKVFRNIDLSGKKYVPFCSAIYNEALLSLYFQSKRATVYHLFHGVFGNYKLKISNDISSACCVHADYYLPFGEATKRTLIEDFGINESQICVAGNPKYPKKDICVKNTFSSCLVLGATGSYDAEFERLLPILENVATKKHIQFYLKPHPNSQIAESNVLKQCKHIQLIGKTELIANLFTSGRFDSAITFNTTAYYECMYFNILPLRWAVGENYDFKGFDDKFYDEESLLQKIESYQTKSIEQLNSEVSQLLVEVLGMGINNYNEILNATQNYSKI